MSSTVFDPKYAALAGVHRVQRVPATEKNGRRHSSEIVVAIIGDTAGTSSEIDPGDVRTDVYRDSGPGGQHRNTSDTAVRLTHIPTGTVVTAADSRSQHQNRRVAWQRLEAALSEANDRAAHAATNKGRAATFDAVRTFTWTGWRDQVKHPAGSAVMSRVLAGRLDPLLRRR